MQAYIALWLGLTASSQYVVISQRYLLDCPPILVMYQ